MYQGAKWDKLTQRFRGWHNWDDIALQQSEKNIFSSRREHKLSIIIFSEDKLGLAFVIWKMLHNYWLGYIDLMEFSDFMEMM